MEKSSENKQELNGKGILFNSENQPLQSGTPFSSLSREIKFELQDNVQEMSFKIGLPNPYFLKRYFPCIQYKKITKGGKEAISNPDIPKKAGIYFLYKNNEIVYAGKSHNVGGRIEAQMTDEEKFITESDNPEFYSWLINKAGFKVREETEE